MNSTFDVHWLRQFLFAHGVDPYFYQINESPIRDLTPNFIRDSDSWTIVTSERGELETIASLYSDSDACEFFAFHVLKHGRHFVGRKHIGDTELFQRWDDFGDWCGPGSLQPALKRAGMSLDSVPTGRIRRWKKFRLGRITDPG